MKVKAIFIYFLCLNGCILFFLFDANSAQIDPYPNVIIPIFQGGYEVQKHFDSSKKTKSIRYYVRTGAPPADVLEFYDAYFNGSGWQSSFETCQRNWADLSEGTKTAGFLLRQLFASWEHTEFNLKAELWLTYEMVNEGHKNEVSVKCRIQPKVDK